MEAEIVKLEFQGKALERVYGGTRVDCIYRLTTKTEGLTNNYNLVAEVKGIEVGEPYMYLRECSAKNNNEHTLDFEAVRDLLNW